MEVTERNAHTHTHTLTWDSDVELGTLNVGLMTGLYELKQSAEHDCKEKDRECLYTGFFTILTCQTRFDTEKNPINTGF